MKKEIIFLILSAISVPVLDGDCTFAILFGTLAFGSIMTKIKERR